MTVKDPAEYADEIESRFNSSNSEARQVAEQAVEAMEASSTELSPVEFVDLLEERGADELRYAWNELVGHWSFLDEFDASDFQI